MLSIRSSLRCWSDGGVATRGVLFRGDVVVCFPVSTSFKAVDMRLPALLARLAQFCDFCARLEV